MKTIKLTYYEDRVLYIANDKSNKNDNRDKFDTSVFNTGCQSNKLNITIT